MVTQKARSKPKGRKKEPSPTSTTSESVENTDTDLVSLQSSPSSLATLTPSAEDVRDILTFETVKALAEFYRAVGWTPVMELQILINIIQTTDNDVTRLRALKDLQTRRAEILRNSGLMVKATKVQKDADGGQTMFSANIVAATLNYNPKSEEPKGVINEQKQEKETLPTETVETKEPLGNDGDARGGTDNGDASDAGNNGAGAGTESGDVRQSNIGHKPPSGGSHLTGIASRRG